MKASELVQKLIDKWNKISMFISAAVCPFTDELESRDSYCDSVTPPCDECLAIDELCAKYLELERNASREVFSVLKCLNEHKIIYKRYENEPKVVE